MDKRVFIGNYKCNDNLGYIFEGRFQGYYYSFAIKCSEHEFEIHLENGYIEIGNCTFLK